jgi:hypothetical protein
MNRMALAVAVVSLFAALFVIMYGFVCYHGS